MPETVPGKIGDPSRLECFFEPPTWVSGSPANKLAVTVLPVQFGKRVKRRGRLACDAEPYPAGLGGEKVPLARPAK